MQYNFRDTEDNLRSLTFVLHHSVMHSQQNRCPHGVDVECLLSSRQRIQRAALGLELRVCWGLDTRSKSSAWISCRSWPQRVLALINEQKFWLRTTRIYSFLYGSATVCWRTRRNYMTTVVINHMSSGLCSKSRVRHLNSYWPSQTETFPVIQNATKVNYNYFVWGLLKYWQILLISKLNNLTVL